jgi:hypothetical protein
MTNQLNVAHQGSPRIPAIYPDRALSTVQCVSPVSAYAGDLRSLTPRRSSCTVGTAGRVARGPTARNRTIEASYSEAGARKERR